MPIRTAAVLRRRAALAKEFQAPAYDPNTFTLEEGKRRIDAGEQIHMDEFAALSMADMQALAAYDEETSK